jgi:hypothetical protein
MNGTGPLAFRAERRETAHASVPREQANANAFIAPACL